MTEPMHENTGWEDLNADFLAASMTWLRLVLRRYVAEHGDHAAQPVTAARRRTWWVRDLDGEQPAEEAVSGTPVTDRDLERARADVTAAEQGTPAPALVELAARLGLSRFERDLLLLCAAIELDPAVPLLCASAHRDPQMRFPTFGLAMELLPNPAWDVVSPGRGLRFWRLIEITQRPGDGLIAAALRADERIVNYIKGLNYLDDRLSPLMTRIDGVAAMQLPASQRDIAARVEREWRLSSLISPIVQLTGADDAGKRLIAADAADRCGLLSYRLPVELLPVQPLELDNLARLWERESALLPLALYVDASDSDGDGAPVRRFLGRVGGPVALAARESWSELGRPSLALDVAPPTAPERAQAWRHALGDGASERAIDTLAAQFALEVNEIHEVAALAVDADDAWRECRVRTRPRIDALAQRLEPSVDWDDIVLTDHARALLEQVADQVAHRTTVYERWGFGGRNTRGLGVSVLFAGPSGTGKTMAAEVLATRLQLDLYRIDLSAVVSKYIGETEKNLRRMFDAAEGGGSILLFDECDSLFGKRTEVKDSHDRYANIEINYLLQRMENYRGVAILATNMRTALDVAFLRRLRFVVEFAFPGPAERLAIWSKSFPAVAPTGDLDFDRLAQLPVTGGMARNIAVNAAFLAAASESPITMPLVLAAARAEFEKLELPILEREFVFEEVTAR